MLDYSESVHGPLTDSEYFGKLATSSVVVNFSESRFDHDFINPNVLLGCNLRDFETTMSGTFLCTQHSDELPLFFEEGKEVVSFKNEHELVDKLKFYTAHEPERNEIARAGYKRAVQDHTWQKRFQDFFISLNLV